MSTYRRRVLRGVFWAGVVGALATGVTLAALDHLLLASAVLIGSVVPLAALTHGFVIISPANRLAAR